MGILCQGPYWIIINELSIHKEPNALQVCWKVKPVDNFWRAGARASCIIVSCACLYVDPNLISHYLTL
jgi:hypothetical protein